MSALNGRDARRAAYEQAKAAGCTCRPSIATLPSGLIQVRHDEWCPLVHAGQTAVLVVPDRAGMQQTVHDLSHAIDLAERSAAIVMCVAEAALIVPPSIDVPPTVAEFAEIVRVERPGGTVRICTLSDETAMAMMPAAMGGQS